MSERFEYLVREQQADPELVIARAELAHRQTELLTALVAGGPIPAGFDPARVQEQAHSLAGKRADTVARVVPEPARILGRAYRPLFHRYAGAGPQVGGYRADGLAFAAWALAAEPEAAWHAELDRWLNPHPRGHRLFERRLGAGRALRAASRTARRTH